MSKLDMKGRNGWLAGSTVGIPHPADLPDGKEQGAEREACACRWIITGGGTDFLYDTCPFHTPPARLTDED